METFYDIGDSGEDLRELWENDFVEDSMKFNADQEMLAEWFSERDMKIPHVILNDKLMSDAILGTLPIKTEHSYSLNSDGDSIPDSPVSLQTKIDEMDEECYPAISMTAATGGNVQSRRNQQILNKVNAVGINRPINSPQRVNQNTSNMTQNVANRGDHMQIHNYHGNSINHLNDHIDDSESSSFESDDIDLDDLPIKEEPLSPSSSCPPSPDNSGHHHHIDSHSRKGNSGSNLSHMTSIDDDMEYDSKWNAVPPQSLLKNHQIIMNQTRLNMPKLNIKMEPNVTLTTNNGGNVQGFNLPPTPPSSLPSDDSEGNQSPEHSSPMSPPITTGNNSVTTSSATTRRTLAHHQQQQQQQGRLFTGSSSSRQPIHTPLISSQPKGSTGTLILTEEEKRTLLAEGYPIPTRLPLTKAEEKSLKKIRRKIKNKISAQESRRKKKEYMDQLERKVEILVSENTDYRKRIESLEGSNANLLSQLAKLQTLISRQSKRN